MFSDAAGHIVVTFSVVKLSSTMFSLVRYVKQVACKYTRPPAFYGYLENRAWVAM